MTGRMIMRVASTSALARYAAAAAKCRSFRFNNSIKATATATTTTMEHKASNLPTQVFLPFFLHLSNEATGAAAAAGVVCGAQHRN